MLQFSVDSCLDVCDLDNIGLPNGELSQVCTKYAEGVETVRFK